MFDNQNRNETDLLLSILPTSAERQPDPEYLYRRAEQELELAQSATHPAVVKAHYLLAGHYLDSLYGPESAVAAEGVAG